jgi:hypothetical protein
MFCLKNMRICTLKLRSFFYRCQCPMVYKLVLMFRMPCRMATKEFHWSAWVQLNLVTPCPIHRQVCVLNILYIQAIILCASISVRWNLFIYMYIYIYIYIYELITRPEESYRLWWVVVCDLETSRIRRLWPELGRSAKKKKKMYIYIYIIRII